MLQQLVVIWSDTVTHEGSGIIGKEYREKGGKGFDTQIDIRGRFSEPKGEVRNITGNVMGQWKQGGEKKY